MKTTPTLLLLALTLLPAALAAQPSAAGDSELIKYMRGENADPACGVCIKSADRFLKNLRDAALAQKTKGMALVPAGEYQIGSEPGRGDPDERPRHKIWLDAFFIDKQEVSLADYQFFVKSTRGNHPEWDKPGGKFNLETGKEKYYRRLSGLIQSCPACPVFGVFWEDAAAYCAWKKRRLPTEAEWEVAAAAGSPNKYSFGDSPADAGDFAWFADNSGETPHKGGAKGPNALGLYDMTGNVWEWVHDFYGKTYYEISLRKNPRGPDTGREHVIRGGSWASEADELGVTNRANYAKANDDIGFRCAVAERDLGI
jgi:sulfatase modifying factor 1